MSRWVERAAAVANNRSRVPWFGVHLSGPWILWAILAFSPWTIGVAHADPLPNDHREMLAALRQRGLWRLLERQLEASAELPKLNESDRLDLLGERAGLLSDLGSRTLDSSQRSAQWTKADALVESWLRDHPDSPNGLPLRFRWSSQLLARSSVLYELSTLAPADASIRADIRRWARRAIDVARDCQTVADSGIKDRQATARRAAEWREDQLAGIKQASLFNTGMGWLAVARIEPEGVDRTNALSQARTILAPFARDDSTLPITIESQLALAEVFWRAGEGARGLKVLERIEKPETPAEALARSRRLKGRILLATDKVEEALRVLRIPAENRTPGAEWDLLLIEALLRTAAHKRTFAPSESAQLDQQAVDVVDAVGKKFGPLWGRRGDQLLARYLRPDAVASDPRLLERLADVFRQEKQFADARSAVDLGMIEAEKRKDFELAGKLAFTAARIQLEAGQSLDAANRFVAMADRFPRHSLAPRALLQAASIQGRSLPSSPGADLSKAYQATLQKIVERYPSDREATPKAHRLLARMAEGNRRWGEAIEHYTRILASEEHYADAVAAIAGIVHDHIGTNWADIVVDGGQLNRTLALQLIERALSAKAPASSSDLKPDVARSTTLATFVLARLLSTGSREEKERAIRLLREKVVSSESATLDLRGRGWRLLLDLARSIENKDLAVKIASEGFPRQEAELLRALGSVDLLSEELSPASLSLEAALAEAASNRLLASQSDLPEADRLRVRLMLARAYIARGDLANAERLLRRLLVEQDRDAGVLTALAECQFAQGKHADALQTWDRLRQGRPRGSPGWFDAVYHSARCQQKLGQGAQARRTLETVLKLYPDGGSPIQRQRITRLLSELPHE